MATWDVDPSSGYTIESDAAPSIPGSDAQGAPGRVSFGVGTGDAQLTWAWKVIPSAGAEDPGAFSGFIGTTRDHRMQTVAIRPSGTILIPTNSQTTWYDDQRSAGDLVFDVDGTITALADDDYLVILATKDDNATDFNTPTGFTEWFQFVSGAGDDSTIAGYYKLITDAASEGDVTLSVSGGDSGEEKCGVCFIVRNADRMTFEDVTPPAGVDQVNTTSPDPGSITTVTNGAVVIVVEGARSDVGTLLTTAAGFTVEQAGWQWFEDGTGSLTALAAENAKPTLPGDENYGVIRLRVELEETDGGSDANKIVKAQYSGDDGVTFIDMLLDDGSADDQHLVVADGADVAGNTITSRLLTNTDTDGKYHETQVLVETLNANQKLEVDFAMWTRCVVPDRDYRFRLFWDGAAIPIKAGAVKVELRGSTHATRQYTDGVLNSIAGVASKGVGEPESNSWGHGHRGFFDGARWWVFYIDESATLVSYKSTASLTSGGWGAASTRSFTNIQNNNDFNVVFKEIGGTKYVLLVVGDTRTQRYFRRGTISGSVITWDTTERSYSNPHDDENQGACPVAIDDGNFLWFGGKGVTSSNEIWVQRSVNTFDDATYHTFNSAKSASESGIGGAAPFDECELVGLASSEVLVVYYAQGSNNLRARKCTESGGMGSAVTLNTTTDAHDTDWAVIRDVGGNEVYCLYGNENSNSYDMLLHVYNVSGDSWSAGTDPLIDKTGDSTANDGIVAHWGDDGNLYVFYTISGTGTRDTRIRNKDYTGGTGGTWSAITDVSPSEIGNGDPTGVVRDGANAVILIERGDVSPYPGSDFALEYYVVDTSVGGAQALTWEAAAVETDTPADWSVVAAGAVALVWDGISETDTPADWSVLPGVQALVWEAAAETATPADWSVLAAGSVAVAWDGTAETDTPADWAVTAAGAVTLTWETASEIAAPADWSVVVAGSVALIWEVTAETDTPADWAVVASGSVAVAWDGAAETDTPADWAVTAAGAVTLAWEGVSEADTPADWSVLPGVQALVWEAAAEAVTGADWSVVASGAATLVWDAATETDSPADWSILATGSVTLIWEGVSEADTPADWAVDPSGSLTVTWDGISETATPADWSVTAAGSVTLAWDGASETDSPADWAVTPATVALVWDGASEAVTPADWSVTAAGSVTVAWDGATETDTPADWLTVAVGAVALTWDGATESATPADWSVVAAGSVTLVWEGISETATPADWAIVASGAAVLVWDGASETASPADWVVSSTAGAGQLVWDGAAETASAADWSTLAAGSVAVVFDPAAETDTPGDWVVAAAGAVALTWDGTSEADTGADWAVVVAGAATVVWEGVTEIDTPADWLVAAAGAVTLTWDGTTETDTAGDWSVVFTPGFWWAKDPVTVTADPVSFTNVERDDPTPW